MRTIILFALIVCGMELFAQSGVLVKYRATNNAYFRTIEWLKSKNRSGEGRALIDASRDSEVRAMELAIHGTKSVFDRNKEAEEEDESIDDNSGPRITIITPNYLGEGRSIYKDRELGRTTIAQKYKGRTFLLEDSVQPLWQTSNERTTILGMECMKATCNDTVTAWYAIDIPIPDGPDTYWGLPGLILRLDDGLEQYECVAIEDAEDKLKRIPKGRRVSATEFHDIVRGRGE